MAGSVILIKATGMLDFEDGLKRVNQRLQSRAGNSLQRDRTTPEVNATINSRGRAVEVPPWASINF